MIKVVYECGCTAAGDLISAHCPMHPTSPIVEEIVKEPCTKLATNPDADLERCMHTPRRGSDSGELCLVDGKWVSSCSDCKYGAQRSGGRSRYDIKEGQIWRKRGPHGWLKIIQILDPEYQRYDGGCHGARVVYFPPQLKGIQCRGGVHRFLADCRLDGSIISWEEQIIHNRYVLCDGWNRGNSV